ncbi:MAG: hypothetical protein BMS9Abin32_363 [Gammaproteobacteria bacterium]|nr:MAG: hypothetical protein BMS9Abin32_363 [Gammaproteobacteria bacterium]
MAATDNTLRHILVEMKYSDAVFASAMTLDGTEAKPLKKDFLKNLPGCELDTDFLPVEIPRMIQPDGAAPGIRDPFDLSMGRSIGEEHESNTFLLRSTVAENDLADFEVAAKSDRSVEAIYADPMIEETSVTERSEEEMLATLPRVCPASPPLGSDRHVAARLGVPWLRRRRMDGRGVYMAIVDTGINLAYLRRRGRMPMLDTARSWMARPGDLPGRLPVGHGTMVAYDTMIAAPRATLLDIALLRSSRRGGSIMAGLLSDAIRAYAHLYRVVRGPHRPGAFASLVVNNSWGMFHDSWDFPRGHPGRYADNPAHPFNRIVGVLAHAGADILFAAGNCGRECPDGRCQGVTDGGIYGANSHSQVITVAGVDVLKRRVGYSTSGPGKITYLKPDLCGYTHFRGSGVYPADGGTSAATPVVAGLVAAFRSRFPYNAADFRTSPAAIRNLLMRTAEDRGSIGFDFDFGWGIANGRRLALIRSLSVMQPQEQAATSIDELTDVEAVLDRIDGLELVEPMPEEMEAAREEKIAEIPAAGELDVLPEVESLRAAIAAGHGPAEETVTKAQAKLVEAMSATAAAETDGTASGAELH